MPLVTSTNGLPEMKLIWSGGCCASVAAADDAPALAGVESLVAKRLDAGVESRLPAAAAEALPREEDTPGEDS